MFLIIGSLLLTPAVGFIDCFFHRVRHPVGIKNNFPPYISGCPSRCLHEGNIRSQKSLFIRIKDGNQRYFGKIETFPQEVNTDKDIKLCQAEITQDIHPLQCIYFGMQITNLYIHIPEIISQIFRHSFCQCSNQCPFLPIHPLSNLPNQIIDLCFYRPDFDYRIDQTGWPDNLFDNDPFTFGQFIFCRSRRYE